MNPTPPAPQEAPLVALRGVGKSFENNPVLHDVSFTLGHGEIVGLVGENGAGKSTILSLIVGIHPPSAGSLAVRGEEVGGRWSPRAAREHGIHIVQQELSLNPHQSIAENLTVGAWPTRRGVVSRRLLRAEARRLLDLVHLDADPDEPVARLPMDQRQLVELAKSVRTRPDVLILDEATSSLDGDQVATLLAIVRGLRDEGTTVIMVSHRMEELFACCDRLIVLKDGAVVDDVRTAETSEGDVVAKMLGRELSEMFPAKRDVTERPAGLAVRGFRADQATTAVDLDFPKGAITGIGGLQGQGQRTLLRALFGLVRHQGTVELDGARVTLGSPRRAMRRGLAMISDDRKHEGLHLGASVSANLALTNLARIAPLSLAGTVSRSRERTLVAETVRALSIRAVPRQEARRLSGGTQQKVSLGKWLPRRPQVLLLAEPTRGIDVGTKREIYGILRGLADDGATIVVTSGDTLELVGLCDVVHVMYEGSVVTTLTGSEITEESLVRASLGEDFGAVLSEADAETERIRS